MQWALKISALKYCSILCLISLLLNISVKSLSQGKPPVSVPLAVVTVKRWAYGQFQPKFFLWIILIFLNASTHKNSGEFSFFLSNTVCSLMHCNPYFNIFSSHRIAKAFREAFKQQKLSALTLLTYPANEQWCFHLFLKT